MKGVTMAPINPNKDWDDIKLNVTVDGKKVDLEDAFEVFEGVFDDVEDVFKEMENVFSRVDSNIKDKMNKLKVKVAAKKPEKYDFVAEDDTEKKWQEHMRWKIERRKRAAKNLKVLAVVGLLFLFIMFGVAFFVSMDKDGAEFGAPPKGKPTVTEKLERL
jgi:hypothetical protein